MKTLITKSEQRETVKCTFEGLKLKHISEGGEPEVMVVEDGDKSNGDEITICLFLQGKSDNDEFEIEGQQTIPLSVVLKHCLFDVECFMTGSDNTPHSAFDAALDYALNALGAIRFTMEGGLPKATFEFGNHYVHFYFGAEDARNFFENV